MERPFTVPKQRLRTPRFRMSKFTRSRSGCRIFLYPQRKSEGINSKTGERARHIINNLIEFTMVSLVKHISVEGTISQSQRLL